MEHLQPIIVGGIPVSFHVRDLRCFFSKFVEEENFVFFHYRHRIDCFDNSACWCPILMNKRKVDGFLNCFSEMNWVNSVGDILSQRCQIIENVDDFLLRRNFAGDDFSDGAFKELRRYPSLPRGNVGTPTSHFFNQIEKCSLPAGVIKKLGLKFPNQRSNRRYGSVPFSYDAERVQEKANVRDSVSQLATNTGFKLNRYDSEELKRMQQQKRYKKSVMQAKLARGPKRDDSSGSDGEEDWERGERLHENVFAQDRIKERLFEEEAELVWEKGGPGLVFYCDSALWDEAKGGIDERATDDWDVDMSLYMKGHEPNADKDMRDFVDMRKSQLLRNGEEAKVNATSKKDPEFAKRLMMKNGWKPGSGLGSSQPGIVEPIEPEGELKPNERRGLGYYGEKLNRTVSKKRAHDSTDEESVARISTVYDPLLPQDVCESLLQWAPATTLKQRKTYVNTHF